MYQPLENPEFLGGVKRQIERELVLPRFWRKLEENKLPAVGVKNAELLDAVTAYYLDQKEKPDQAKAKAEAILKDLDFSAIGTLRVLGQEKRAALGIWERLSAEQMLTATNRTLHEKEFDPAQWVQIATYQKEADERQKRYEEALKNITNTIPAEGDGPDTREIKEIIRGHLSEECRTLIRLEAHRERVVEHQNQFLECERTVLARLGGDAKHWTPLLQGITSLQDNPADSEDLKKVKTALRTVLGDMATETEQAAKVLLEAPAKVGKVQNLGDLVKSKITEKYEGEEAKKLLSIYKEKFVRTKRTPFYEQAGDDEKLKLVKQIIREARAEREATPPTDTVLDAIQQKIQLLEDELAVNETTLADRNLEYAEYGRRRKYATVLRRLLRVAQNSQHKMILLAESATAENNEILAKLKDADELDRVLEQELKEVMAHQDVVPADFWQKLREEDTQIETKATEWKKLADYVRQHGALALWAGGKKSWKEEGVGTKSFGQRQQELKKELADDDQALAAAQERAKALMGNGKEELDKLKAEMGERDLLREHLEAKLKEIPNPTEGLKSAIEAHTKQAKLGDASSRMVTEAAAAIEERVKALAARLNEIKDNPEELRKYIDELQKLIAARIAAGQKKVDEDVAQLESVRATLHPSQIADREAQIKRKQDKVNDWRGKSVLLNEARKTPVEQLDFIKSLGEEALGGEILDEARMKAAAEAERAAGAPAGTVARKVSDREETADEIATDDDIMEQCCSIKSMADFYRVANRVFKKNGFFDFSVTSNNFGSGAYFQTRTGDIYRIGSLSPNAREDSEYFGWSEIDMVKSSAAKADTDVEDSKMMGMKGSLAHFAYWLFREKMVPVGPERKRALEEAEEKKKKEQAQKLKQIPRQGKFSLNSILDIMAGYKILKKGIETRLEDRSRTRALLFSSRIAGVLDKLPFCEGMKDRMEATTMQEIFKRITGLSSELGEIQGDYIIDKYNLYKNNPKLIFKDPIHFGAICLQVIKKTMKTRQQVYEDFNGPTITGIAGFGGAAMDKMFNYYSIPGKFGDEINKSWGAGKKGEYEKGESDVGDTRDNATYFNIFKGNMANGRLYRCLAIFDKFCNLGTAADWEITAMAMMLMSAKNLSENNDDLARRVGNYGKLTPIPWLSALRFRGFMQLIHEVAEQNGVPIAYMTKLFARGEGKEPDKMDNVVKNAKKLAKMMCHGGLFYETFRLKNRASVVLKDDSERASREVTRGQTFNLADIYSEFVGGSVPLTDDPGRAGKYDDSIYASVGFHSIALKGSHVADQWLWTDTTSHGIKNRAQLETCIWGLNSKMNKDNGEIYSWSYERRHRCLAGFAPTFIDSWKKHGSGAMVSIFKHRDANTRECLGVLLERMGFVFDIGLPGRTPGTSISEEQEKQITKAELKCIVDQKTGVAYDDTSIQLEGQDYKYGVSSGLSGTLEDKTDVREGGEGNGVNGRKEFLARLYLKMEREKKMDVMKQIEETLKKLYDVSKVSLLTDDVRRKIYERTGVRL